MNKDAALIRAISAIPINNSVPLTCEINTANLVCVLGQRFKILNSYMEMLAGINEPYTGSVSFLENLFNDQIYNGCPEISYLYNNSRLLSILNGIDNVKVPALYHNIAPIKEINRKVYALLGELEYEANHKLLPAFMDTLQKRHLLIVRAIILNPRVLFIENPFRDLDREQVRIFGRYIAGLVKGKNITVITSNVNLDFVKNYADQVIYLTATDVHVFNQWEAFSYYIKSDST